MPMAKHVRQIWTEKLGRVHPLPFSGVIFREIGHLTTIPIFWSNQCKKSTNYKTRMNPRDLQNQIILYSDYIIQDAHKNQEKHTPPKAAAIRLTGYYSFPCAQNHAPVTKIPSRQTNATDRDSRADRTAPISKRFLLPNITYILIIHSGSVARTVPIKNHGQDSRQAHLHHN